MNRNAPVSIGTASYINFKLAHFVKWIGELTKCFIILKSKTRFKKYMRELRDCV